MKPLVPAPFPVGARVRFLGATMTRLEGTERIDAGAVGEVVATVQPRRGTGRILDYLDGEPLVDDDSPGRSVIVFPGYTFRFGVSALTAPGRFEVVCDTRRSK